MNYLSIDQNSNGLWDALPKLAALAAHGHRGTHYLEDVDMAFTRHGARAGDPLKMLPERFYHGGVSDWGAALFYTDLLGAQPWDLTELPSCLGISLAALARKLGLTVDELYDRHSPSANWQLTGPSYLTAGRHRTIGDLRLRELAQPLRWLLRHAREDIAARFPETDAQARAETWLSASAALVEQHLADAPDELLPMLYGAWLRQDLGDAAPRITLTSDLFRWDPEHAQVHQMLSLFLQDYPTMRDAYNQALMDSHSPLHPLRDGELPFFVVFRQDQRMWRCPASLHDGKLCADQFQWTLPPSPAEWPWERMQKDGVLAVTGKAIVLVNIVRTASGANLALPHLGSVYMPAGHAFARNLAALGHPVSHTVQRVRFRFLERWRGCRTIVRLPDDLARITGVHEAPAQDVADELLARIPQADQELRALANPNSRASLLERRFTTEKAAIAELHERKRAQATAKSPDYQSTLAQIRAAETGLAQRQVECIADLVRVRDLAFFDSRGALLPWALALGGQEFYQDVLRRAEIAAEPD